MAKQYKVLVNTGKAENNKAIDVQQYAGDKGQPVRIKAQAGTKYQLQELGKDKGRNTAPDYVKAKRNGKNLEIAFENGTSPDLIIEGYYDEMPAGYNGLIGQAENGSYYEYIPEDPNPQGLIPELADGARPVNVALGAAEVSPAGAAVGVLAFPLLAPLGLLGAGAAALAAANNAGTNTPVVTGALQAAAPNDSGTLGDNRTNDSTPTLTGTVPAGSTATITINGQTYPVTVNADGTWSFTQPTNLPDGTYTPVLNVTTNGVTTATPITPFTIDTVTNVDITNPGSAGTLNPISGTAEPGDTIVVKDSTGKVIGTTTAAADGKWSITPTSAVPAGTITATATDAAGNTATDSDSAATTSNSSKTALSIDPISDNVILASEQGVANYTVTGKVTGVFKTGDTVSLTLNGKNYTTTVAADGSYSMVVPMADLLADPDTKIEGKVTGTGGDTATAAQDYTVEASNTPAKTALSINPVTADNILSASENTGSIAITGKVTGKFAAGDTVTLTVNGKTFTGKAAAVGSYSIAVPAADLSSDTDTTVDGTVTGTGGTTATAIQDYGLDTASQDGLKTALTINPITGDNIVTANEQGAATIPVTGKVTGTFAAGDMVQLTLNGKIYTAPVAADGSYTAYVSPADIKQDADTKIEGVVIGTGGDKATAAQDYTLEAGNTPTQTALSLDPVTTDNILSPTEAAGAVNISGKVTGPFSPNDTVTVMVNGKPYTGKPSADGTFSIPVPGSELAADPNTTIEATVTGTGGTPAAAMQDYGVGTTTNGGLKTALSINPITGDNIVTANEQGAATIPVTGKVTGTFAAGDLVTLTLNGKLYTATVAADGSYTANVAMSDLKADSDTKIEGTVTGTNGDTATAAQDYTFEAGNTPTQTALSLDPVTTDNILSPTEAAGTVNITGKVTGPFSPNDTVTVMVNGKPYTGKPSADGTFSIPVPGSELAADPNTTIEATVTGTGGTPAAAMQDYGVGTTTPSGTTTGALSPTSDNNGDGITNPQDSDNITKDPTPDLSGTVPTGSTATVTLNGQTYPVTVNPDGTWNFTQPTNLPDGTYYPVLNVTTGGVTKPTNLTPFTIDTTPPTIAITSSANALGAGQTATITFTLSEVVSDFIWNATTQTGDIAVTGGTLGTLVQSTTDPKVWTAVFTPAAGTTPGSATISVASAKFSDAAGNFNTDGAEANNTVTLTTNASTTGGLDPNAVNPNGTPNDSGAKGDNLTNDPTPTLSGKVPAGSTAQVDINGTKYPVNVNPDGTWSFTNPTNLPDGTYTPQLIVTPQGSSTPNAPVPLTPFTIDTTPPTVAITSSATALTSGQTAAITFTLSEASSDFTAADVVVSGGTLSNFQQSATNPLVYTATFTPASTGTSGVISVASDKFADAAANTNKDGADANNTVNLSINATTTGQLSPASDNATGTPNDNKTNDPTPELTGKVPAGSTATVTINGQTYPVNVNPDGTYTFTQPTNLPDGTYTPVLNVTTNGQTTSTPVTPFTVDTTPPTVAITSPVTTLAAGASATLTFTVSEATTDLTIGDIQVTGGTLGPLQQSATDPKVYTATFMAAANATGASTASVSIASNKFTDAAGNNNTDGADTNNTWTWTVNSGSKLTALTIDPITGDNIISTSESGATSVTVTGKVTGTFVAGDKVTLVLNGTPYVTAVAADGSYSVSVAMSDLKADADTKIEGSVTGTGGSAATAAQDYQVQSSTNPRGLTGLSIDPVTADNVIGQGEDTGNITITGTVTGAFSTTDTVTLTLNGKTFTAKPAADGTYSVSVPAADLVADADTKIEGTITGTGGTVADAIQDYAVNPAAAPDPSTKTALYIDPISSDVDNILTLSEQGNAITKVTGFVSGKYAAGDKVTLSINGSNYLATVAADGTWSVDVATTDLVKDADTKVEGTVTGTGGSTATAAQDYVVQTSTNIGKITALSIDPVTEDNLIDATEAGASTIAVTGQVTGAFSVNDTVTLTINGKTYTGKPNAQGVYSINVPTADLIADKDTTIDGTVTGTGGTKADAIQDYAVDSSVTPAPTNPDPYNPANTGGKTAISIDAITGDNVMAASDTGNINVTGKVSGTFAVNDTVTLYVNGTTYTGKVLDTAGNYSIAVKASDLLADKDTKIEADVTGTGGDKATAAQDYIIEANPSAPTQTALSIDPITGDNFIAATEKTGTLNVTGKVSGKFAVGDTVTLMVNDKPYTGKVLDAAGNYSIAVPATDVALDADTTITGTVVGTGGSAANAMQNYAVDTASPVTPTTDTTPPTIIVARTNTTSGLVLDANAKETITFTLSEASTTFDASDIVVTGGTLSNFVPVPTSGTAATGYTQYTAVFTPTAGANGTATIGVASGKFTDNAGNANQDTYLSPAPSGATSESNNKVDLAYDTRNTSPANVDTDKPTVQVSIDKTSLAAGQSATLTFVLSEPSSDFTLADIDVISGGGTLSNLVAVPGSNGVQYTATYTAGTIAGAVVIGVDSNKFSDAAGNFNADTYKGSATGTSAVGGTTAETNNWVTLTNTGSTDTTPPTVAITRTGSGTVGANGETVVFTLSEASSDFAMNDVDVTGGSLTNWVQISPTQYSATFVPTSGSTGSATIGVLAGKFHDAANNLNKDTYTNPATGTDVYEANNQLALNYNTSTSPTPADTTAPTIAITASATTLGANQTATVTFTLSEASTDFTQADVTVTGGTLSNWVKLSPTEYTATYTPNAGSTGTGSVSVASNTFSDAAANYNTDGADANNTVSFVTNNGVLPTDTTPPTIEVKRLGSGTLSGTSSETIEFTLSEASKDFTLADITVTGGTLSNLAAVPTSGSAGTGYTTYVATFKPNPNPESTTPATIGVLSNKFSDAAGNFNKDTYTNPATGTDVYEANNLVTIPVNTFSPSTDTTTPTVVVARAGSGTLAVNATETITFTLSEPSLTFDRNDVTFTGGQLTNWTMVAASGTPSTGYTVYTATFVPDAGTPGTATIGVQSDRFTDAAGNNNKDTYLTTGAVGTTYEANNQVSIAFDTTMPSKDVTAPTVEVVRSGTGTITGPETIYFNFSEATTDFALTDITVSGGTMSNLVAVAGSGNKQYIATFTPNSASTGTAAIGVKAATFSDATGNFNKDTFDANDTATGAVVETNNQVSASYNTQNPSTDSTPPTVALSRSGTGAVGSAGETIVFVFSEAVTNLTATNIVDTATGSAATGISNLQAVAGSGGTQYTATYTPPTGSVGTITLGIKANAFADTVGNQNLDTYAASADNVSGHIIEANNQLTLGWNTDTTTPNISVNAATNTLNGNATTTVTFTLSEASSDFNQSMVDVTGGTLSNWTKVDATHYSATFTPNANSQGTATIGVLGDKFKDLAGNLNKDTYASTVPSGQTNDGNNLTSITYDTRNGSFAVANDASSTTEDATTALTGNVLTNDSQATAVTAVGAGATTGSATNLGTTLAGTYGALTLQANGSYTYTLDNTKPSVQALKAGEKVTDIFTYSASGVVSGASQTGSANLVITITGTNDAPVAVVDSASAIESGGLNNAIPGTTPSGNVLTNDTDVDLSDTRTVSAIQAGSGTAQNVTAANAAGDGLGIQGAHGTLHIGTDGSYSYTLNQNDAAVEALLPGSTPVLDTFTYTVKDAAGATSTATLTININGANDAPVYVAGSLSNQTIQAGASTPLNYQFATTAFTDKDTAANGETATYSATLADGSPLPSWLTFNPATRTFSGTPPANTPAGTITVKVTDTDKGGLTANGTFDIVIAAAADTTPPTIAITSNQASLAAGQTATITFTLSEASSDFTWDGSSGDIVVTGGTLSALTQSPTDPKVYTATFTPTANASGTASIGVKANAFQDAAGNRNLDTYDSADTYSGKVVETNNKVDIGYNTSTTTFSVVNDTNSATEDGAAINGNVKTNDALATGITQIQPASAGTATAITAGTTSASTTATTVNGAYGTLKIGADGSYTYTLDNTKSSVQALAAGDKVTDVFTYTATDGSGTKPANLVITITGTNDAPVAVADTASATEQGGSTASPVPGTDPSGNVLTNDTDVDTGDTKAVSAILAGTSGTATSVTAATASAATGIAGAHGTLKIGTDGSYTYTVNQADTAVQALLPTSTALTDTFTYTVKDAAGATSTATLTVSIQGANDAPLVQVALADQNAQTGQAFSYTFAGNAGSATDTFKDVDTGHQTALTYTATLADGSSLPSWLSFNATTRTFSGTPPVGTTPGTITVKVTATDPLGLSTADDFVINLIAGNNTTPTNASVGLDIAIKTDTNNDGLVSIAELNNATTFTSHITVNNTAVVGDSIVINATNGTTAQTPITHVLTASDINNGFDVTFAKPSDGSTQTVTANYVSATGGAATDAKPTDNAKLDATAPSNAAVGLAIAISTDTSNDNVVNAIELNGATTFTSRITVNSTAQVGDKVVINATNGGVAETPITHVLTASDITNGFDVTFAKPADGATQVVTANYVDAAGNAATDTVATDNAKLDATRPTIAITSSATTLTAGQTATITFTLSEASTDFTDADIVLTGGGTLGPISGSGTTYTATYTPPANSTSSVSISVASDKFSDAAGNLNKDGADTDNTVQLAINTGSSSNNSTATIDITSIVNTPLSALSQDTGTSATDFVTSDQTLVYKGTITNWVAGLGDRVMLDLYDTSGSTPVKLGSTVFVTPAADGTWNWNDTATTRPDGKYTLEATIVSATGTTPLNPAQPTSVNGNLTNGGYDQQLIVIDDSAANTDINLALSITTDGDNNGFVKASELGSATSFTSRATFDGSKAQVGDKLTFTATNGATTLASQTVTLTSTDIGRGYVDVTFAKPNDGTTQTVKVNYTNLAGKDATDTQPTDSATLDATVPSNASVGLDIQISTDTSDDGLVNATELNGAATFTSHITFDKTKAVLGDTIVVTAINGTGTPTVVNHVLTSTDMGSGSFDLTFAKPAEGQTQTVTANYVDAAGNAATDTAPTDNAKLDTTAPTNAAMNLALTISTDGNNNGLVSSSELGSTGTFTSHITFDSSKAVAGDTVVVTATNGTGTPTVVNHVLTSAEAGAGAFDLTFAKPANGETQVVTANYVDAAGNTATDTKPSDNAKLDTTAPTIAISATPTTVGSGQGSNTSTITFTLSEASTDFDANDVVATGGTLSGFTGSGTTYTATFTPTSGQTSGTVSVASGKFSDAAGNQNADGSDADNTQALTINVAPVASTTSLSNPLTLSTGPEVTITDNVAGSASNGQTVTYTLTFSEAISAASLTESDLSVNVGSLVSNSLTKVNDTTWTVQATVPATGVAVQSLTVANGSYTSTSGTAGMGGVGIQAYGTATTVGGPEISGAQAQGVVPSGWTMVKGSPDILDPTTTTHPWATSKGNMEGTSLNGNTFAAMSTYNSEEQMGTTLTGLTPGQTYTFGVQWQQIKVTGSAVGTERIGGSLLMTVNGTSQLFTSSGVTDSWQTATMTFVATGTTASVVLAGENTGATGTLYNGIPLGFIGVDSLTAAQITPGDANAGLTLTGTTAADTNLIGADGNDTITAAGGADNIYAGGGDDVIILNTDNVAQLVGSGAMVVDGGSGINRLVIANTTAGTATAVLDLTKDTTLAKLRGINTIDITGPTSTATNNTVKLDYNAVTKLAATADVTTTAANESKMVLVQGNAGDTLQLAGTWTAGASTSGSTLAATYGAAYGFVSGTNYTAYTLGDATVFVASTMTVSNSQTSTTAAGTISSQAVTIESLFGPTFSDANTTTTIKDFVGVAITSAGSSTDLTNKGKYQISTNGGTSWIDLAAGLTDATAIYADKTALIRFVEASGVIGAVPQDLTVRLVDGYAVSANHTTGSTVNVSTNGGMTAYSGNTVTLSQTAVPDTTAPGIAVSSSANTLGVGQTATITFSLSEPSTTFDVSDVTVTGGTLSNFQGSGNTYTATFTPTPNTASGSATISVASGKFTDAAGNANADGVEANNTTAITYDTVAPVFSSAATSALLEGQPTATEAYNATADGDVGVTYTLSGTDAALFDINPSTGVVTFKATPVYATPTDSGANNVYDVVVTATDATGNATNQNVAITVLQQPTLNLSVGAASGAFTPTPTVMGSGLRDWEPQITTTTDGGYVVVWRKEITSENYKIVYQRFDASHNKVGSEVEVSGWGSGGQPQITPMPDGGIVVISGNGFQNLYVNRYDSSNTLVSSTTLNPTNTYNVYADVTVLNDGGYVVSWTNLNDIYVQRFSSANALVGTTKVIDGASTSDRDPLVVATPDNGYVVVWSTSNPTDIFVQKFGSDNNPVGSEVALNNPNGGTDQRPDVTVLKDGSYVVTWEWWPNNGDGNVYVQKFNSNGTTAGSMITLSGPAANVWDKSSSVTALNDGGYVVAWSGYVGGTSTSDLFIQRYDKNNVAVGTMKQVQGSDSSDELPEITATTDGGYVVVWHGMDVATNQSDVYAQKYDASNNPVGPEQRLSGVTNGGTNDQLPQVTALPNGGYAVTWYGSNPTNSATDIFVEAFDGAGVPAGSTGTGTFNITSSLSNLPVSETVTSYVATYTGGTLTVGGTAYASGATIPKATWDAAVAANTVLLSNASATNYSFTLVANVTDSNSGLAFQVTVNKMGTGLTSPLVIDLNGDGVQTLGLDHGVVFDLSGTGQPVKTAWVDHRDGLLAIDRNHDGQINSGVELFGTGTVLANGAKAADGWAALAGLDTNADGVINAMDAQFADLRVWRDTDGDGVTDAGELVSLQDAGIASISLAHDGSITAQNGNLLTGQGVVIHTDGSTTQVTDAWLATEKLSGVEHPMAEAPALDGSLATLNLVGLNDVQLSLDNLGATLANLSGNATPDLLHLNVSDVLQLPTTAAGVHQLEVLGDANDVVDLSSLLADGHTEGQWAANGQVTQNGHTFNVYQYSGDQTLQVLIDQHIVQSNVHLS